MDECLSISQVNNLARTVLEEYSVWIHGEVSNASADKYYYKYFSLKDENASIACVIPSAKLATLDFKIEDGISIKAFGTLSIFERDGKFQFKAELVKKDGEGDLQAKIEAIKQSLQKDGLLDSARKRQLPALPRRIVVITSKDGAAWKDFFKIINERYNNIEIILIDVLVQGEKSAPSIIQALKKVNTLEDIDLVVITRGGGSFEDLMAFNDELLAREIAQSKFPVVSAIGHEKDISISDLVADLRASTPSNAAELIVPQKEALYQMLDILLAKMTKWSEHAFSMKKLELQSTVERTSLTDSHMFSKQFQDALLHIASKLSAHKSIYNSFNMSLQEIELKLQSKQLSFVTDSRAMLQEIYCDLELHTNSFMHTQKTTIENIELKINLNNPLQILKKGYSITLDSNGHIIRSTKHIHKGETVTTQLTDGTYSSNILDIHHEK